MGARLIRVGCELANDWLDYKHMFLDQTAWTNNIFGNTVWILNSWDFKVFTYPPDKGSGNILDVLNNPCRCRYEAQGIPFFSTTHWSHVVKRPPSRLWCTLSFNFWRRLQFFIRLLKESSFSERHEAALLSLEGQLVLPFVVRGTVQDPVLGLDTKSFLGLGQEVRWITSWTSIAGRWSEILERRKRFFETPFSPKRLS